MVKRPCKQKTPHEAHDYCPGPRSIHAFARCPGISSGAKKLDPVKIFAYSGTAFIGETVGALEHVSWYEALSLAAFAFGSAAVLDWIRRG